MTNITSFIIFAIKFYILRKLFNITVLIPKQLEF